jgi:hypothetical protein
MNDRNPHVRGNRFVLGRVYEPFELSKTVLLNRSEWMLPRPTEFLVVRCTDAKQYEQSSHFRIRFHRGLLLQSMKRLAIFIVADTVNDISQRGYT